MIRKWIAVNVVNEWEQSVQEPFSDLDFSHFSEKVKEGGLRRAHKVWWPHTVVLLWFKIMLYDTKLRIKCFGHVRSIIELAAQQLRPELTLQSFDF